MSTSILLIKKEGTHPPIEGMLAGAAEVWAICPGQRWGEPPKAPPDLILLDVDLATREAPEILGKLVASWHKKPAVLLLSLSGEFPRTLGQQVAQLSRIGRQSNSRRPSVKEIVRVLGVSQENLARMLNVSVRTAHRWLRGSRPRPKPELGQLNQVVSQLEQVLPDRAAIQNYLHHSNPNFGDETPIQLLLRREFGRVLADLEGVAEGVYV
jgi:DNA-binding transcriptional regulator YiaG